MKGTFVLSARGATEGFGGELDYACYGGEDGPVGGKSGQSLAESSERDGRLRQGRGSDQRVVHKYNVRVLLWREVNSTLFIYL